ncbi:phosphohydrolase [Patescibacteria group bacterium]
MQCPGQDTKFWSADAIFEVKCPECGHEVEFFKDDPSRKCKKCGYRFINPKLDFGCAAYCPFAQQCIGNLPQGVVIKNGDLLKNKVALAAKHYFGKNFALIGHATRTARLAEQISQKENANLAIVIIASYLHDINIREVATILNRLEVNKTTITEVCDIIFRLDSAQEDESINFKVVSDACTLDKMTEKQKEHPAENKPLKILINKTFFTSTGLNLARKILLK